MTNCMGAQLGANNSLYSIFYIVYSQLPINTNPPVCRAEGISRQSLTLESWVMKLSITTRKTFFYVVSTQTVFNKHGFVRSFQDDKLGGGATWAQTILYFLFSILYSLFSINTNPQSLSCCKHLTATPTHRKLGNEM